MGNICQRHGSFKLPQILTFQSEVLAWHFILLNMAGFCTSVYPNPGSTALPAGQSVRQLHPAVAPVTGADCGSCPQYGSGDFLEGLCPAS